MNAAPSIIPKTYHNVDYTLFLILILLLRLYHYYCHHISQYYYNLSVSLESLFSNIILFLSPAFFFVICFYCFFSFHQISIAFSSLLRSMRHFKKFLSYFKFFFSKEFFFEDFRAGKTTSNNNKIVLQKIYK